MTLTLLMSAASAQQLDPPKLVPTPITEGQRQRVNEGIALHDRGDYDGAIAKYEEVLKENPASVLALYELAFSYSLKKDYRKSLETAYKGAQYQSDTLTGFYLLIGNNLDLLGESTKAVEVYKKGLKLNPNDYLLHYNLAVTYQTLNNLDEAKKTLKKAVAVNPNHPSSHVLLGTIFYKTKYKTPAFFALSRFLILEPNTRRTPGAFNLLQEILGGGVKPGKNPDEVNIFVDLAANKDEGDFGSVDMVMGLSRAANMTEKNKGKSEAELLVDQLRTLISIISEMDPKGDKSKFTWKYYVPYFIEMKKRNHVEAFGYYISQRSNLAGVKEWLQANDSRVNDFLVWSKSFQWPKD
jgi:tetratricopeptide (TPR) repeat protein